LLRDLPNVELLHVTGTDLAQIPDGSVDFAFSFAAMSSMPLRVIAAYLNEIARVLATGGAARLQLYFGGKLETFEEDTIAARTLNFESFKKAIEQLGFTFEGKEELILPFEVSDRDAGAVATMVDLRRTAQPFRAVADLDRMLSAAPERSAGSTWKGSPTEYLMAVARAQTHLESGRVAEARAALELAVAVFADAEPAVHEILAQLREPNRRKVVAPQQPLVTAGPEPVHPSEATFRSNLSTLFRKFPRLAARLEQLPWDESFRAVRSTSGDPVLEVRGTLLDNAEKPVRASEVWVERSLAVGRVRSAAAIAVFGFGGGFHLEALQKQFFKPLHVFEPDLKLLRAVLSLRDLRPALERLESFSTTPREFEEALAERGAWGNTEILIHPVSQIVSRDAMDAARSLFWSKRGTTELRPSIAVVGPIYGGTLPITHSAMRALLGMKQRAQLFDLSRFQNVYWDMKQYVNDARRVDALQTHVVEMLSQVVLEGLTERPADIVISLAQAPLSPRVLTELRSRGTITAMWFTEDCRRFQTWRQLSQYYDYMFVIQRGDIPRLVQEAGAGRAVYLPVGCDPAVHRPLSLSDEERGQWGSQISFVGAGYNNRQQMFASLADRDFKIWGTEWPTCAPFDRLVQQEGRRLKPEEYVKIFNSTAINLNLHSSMERDGVEPFGDFVNPRTFELAASGAFQLVDKRELLPEQFEIGKEVRTFSDRREMLDSIDYYLAHPREREVVVDAARDRALREHTYAHRLQLMLGVIYADRYEQLAERSEAGPWRQTLKAASEYPELQRRLDTLFERGQDPKLEHLIDDITVGKGVLSDTEKKLLFLHHIKSQISYIETKRSGKS
ncbi:MAG: glycosyltransferase, partial [Deltaproteobacteria bacterium]|nr:glycosyltransferase [Deltaproteobacteria bacterium]